MYVVGADAEEDKNPFRTRLLKSSRYDGVNGGFWAGELWKPGRRLRCGVTT